MIVEYWASSSGACCDLGTRVVNLQEGTRRGSPWGEWRAGWWARGAGWWTELSAGVWAGRLLLSACL